MNKVLFKGTMILTLTGFATRLIGFFYRIFLSRIFGAQGMGIYQLTAPVLALSYSVCCAGIQTAVSKYTASEPDSRDYGRSFRILFTAVALSAFLSVLLAVFIAANAHFISVSLLHEARCEALLRIIAVSIPFASIHSCINGYYYGIKSTKIPALCQLGEQLTRVCAVYLLYEYSLSKGRLPGISCAVFGLLAGEIFSCILTGMLVLGRFRRLLAPDLSYDKKHAHCSADRPFGSDASGPILPKLVRMAAPLSLSRVIVNLLAGIEAVYIPQKLLLAGLSGAQALSVYGVLTGMAMPFILFPSTLTNSFSILLLPVISQAQERVDYPMIRRAAWRTAVCSAGFGLFCCLLFLAGGRFAGTFFFHNTLAGHFILVLGFICPFLYLSTTMSSILHGLGHTGISLFINTVSLLIRLAFVFFLIPLKGIEGYLWGILISQIFAAAANLGAVFYNIKKGSSPQRT